MIFDAEPPRPPSVLWRLLKKLIAAGVWLYLGWLALLFFLYWRLAATVSDTAARVGVDKSLTMGLTMLAAPLGLHVISKMIRPGWAGGWRHANAGAAFAVAIYFAVTSLAVPNFQGGAPARCVAATPRGIVTCGCGGHEPDFNRPCLPITPELALAETGYKEGRCVEMEPASTWFDPQGIPQIYYMHTGNGWRFNGCGVFDAETGQQYQPVTPQVRIDYDRSVQDERRK
jgi:hypothetical protein